MKIVSKNNKKTLVLSKVDWSSIGTAAGWIKSHPLDRESDSGIGIRVPENNYYRSVFGSLVNILANSRGVSEKSFSDYDKLMKEADTLLRKTDIMTEVDRFERSKKRADFCAEYLFDKFSN